MKTEYIFMDQIGCENKIIYNYFIVVADHDGAWW